MWNPIDECKIQANQLCAGVSRILNEDGFFLQISFAQPHFRSKYLMGCYVNETDGISVKQKSNEGVSVYNSVQGKCDLYKWNLEFRPIEIDSGSLNAFFYVCKKRG